MNTLGWIVWCIGCAALFLALALARRSRILAPAALLFALFALVVLAVTAFTSFSKLHLLWILPAALAMSYAALWLFWRWDARRDIQRMLTDPRIPDTVKDGFRGKLPQSDEHHVV